MSKHIEVYDNGGETFDRYTIIIDGEVYGMSHNPQSPQGFNQFSGMLSELPNARQGDAVTIESLPEDVQRAIEERARDEEDDSRRYTLYIERDQFADPQRYPDGVAWRSGILDEKGEEVDGEGDLPDYQTAKTLALDTLARLL